MATIRLKGFEPIPEGKYVMKVVRVVQKEAYNKVELTYETAAHKQHTEKFDLNVDGGAWAFSFTAKNLLGDSTIAEVDPDDLVGKYAVFEVTHDVVEYKGRDTVFARARSCAHAEGFDGEEEEHAPKKGKLNLDVILG